MADDTAVPPVPEDTRLTEVCFHHYTHEMVFERAEVAFVMVDLWNTGFGPKPLSHLGVWSSPK